MAGMRGSTSYDEFCEVMSNAKCNKCFGTLKPVDEHKKDLQLLAYWCEECNEYFGVDDTYSEAACHELMVTIRTALENGVLRAETCPGCGNDDIDLFIFDEDEHQRLSLRCMACNYRKAIEDNSDDTTDKETTTDRFPIVCGCGNNNPDIFSVDVGQDEDITIFRCLICDNETPVCLPKAEARLESQQKAAVHREKEEASVEVTSNADHTKSDPANGTLPRNRERSVESLHHAEVFADVAHGTLKNVCKLRRDDYFKIGLGVTETFNVLLDVNEAHKQMKDGTILKKDFRRLVVDIVSTSIGSLAGALLVPVNMARGQTFGTVVGRYIGQWINRLIDND